MDSTICIKVKNRNSSGSVENHIYETYISTTTRHRAHSHSPLWRERMGMHTICTHDDDTNTPDPPRRPPHVPIFCAQDVEVFQTPLVPRDKSPYYPPNTWSTAASFHTHTSHATCPPESHHHHHHRNDDDDERHTVLEMER